METEITDRMKFDLEQTLECGQCFHYVREDGKYYISAFGRELCCYMKGMKFILETDNSEYEEIWKHYFDLERDYDAIQKTLIRADDKGDITRAIKAKNGIHLLNQEFFETLISFIISQNQQIPRIKKIIEAVCEKGGHRLSQRLYAFPTPEEILKMGKNGLSDCKTGFRADYIIDACEKYLSGEICEEELRKMPSKECREKLMQIKGVGPKVANCVMLFSLGKRDAFPVDVWIKRITERIYFDGQITSNSEIEALAEVKFGQYSGYAQQYLFFFGKENGEKQRKKEKMGENESKTKKTRTH